MPSEDKCQFYCVEFLCEWMSVQQREMEKVYTHMQYAYLMPTEYIVSTFHNPHTFACLWCVRVHQRRRFEMKMHRISTKFGRMLKMFVIFQWIDWFKLDEWCPWKGNRLIPKALKILVRFALYIWCSHFYIHFPEAQQNSIKFYIFSDFEFNIFVVASTTIYFNSVAPPFEMKRLNWWRCSMFNTESIIKCFYWVRMSRHGITCSN